MSLGSIWCKLQIVRLVLLSLADHSLVQNVKWLSFHVVACQSSVHTWWQLWACMLSERSAQFSSRWSTTLLSTDTMIRPYLRRVHMGGVHSEVVAWYINFMMHSITSGDKGSNTSNSYSQILLSQENLKPHWSLQSVRYMQFFVQNCISTLYKPQGLLSALSLPQTGIINHRALFMYSHAKSCMFRISHT